MAYSGNLWFLLFPSTMLGRGFWLWSLLLVLPWTGIAQCITLTGNPPNGDLQVRLTVDKPAVRAVTSAGDANLITYTIEITNTAEVPLEHIDFEGQLFDGNDEALAANFFQDYEITKNDFSAPLIPEQNPLRITGDLSLGPGESGEVKVQLELKDIPPRNLLKARVSVFSSDVVDSDLSNNWATVESVVQTEGKDLMIRKTTNTTCLDPSNGNTITLTVINVGTERVDFGTENLRVRDDASTSEADVTLYLNGGWEYLENENANNRRIAFGLNTGDLKAGESTSVSYHLEYGSGYYYHEVAAVIEAPDDQVGDNDTSKEVTFNSRLNGPDGWELVYLQGEKSEYLTVTGADKFGEYNWYYKDDEEVLPGIKPSTAVPGTTSYFVSQSNSGCETLPTEVKVTVVGPETGSIGGDRTACRNMALEIAGSESEDIAGYTYSYEWQVLLPKEEADDLETIEEDPVAWETIDGENGASYSSSSIKDGTKFRRYTILTRDADGKCVRSAPTDPITVSVEPCAVTTNPMMPSRATSPQEP